MTNIKENLNKITTFIFDVDGVLTDGSVILMPDGEQVRTMNVKDGYALQLAAKKGYKICVITGGDSKMVKERLLKLGIQDVYMKAHDKLDVFETYFYSNHLKYEEILYMGDDLPDYDVMKKVGYATCPADSAEEIKSIAHYISPIKGGYGCVRDVVEQVMKIQGTWEIAGW
jgi:3-deoxy-D-manno-octulosonate 8-phosphate phosphatase (KDO 8-P phosphatase)